MAEPIVLTWPGSPECEALVARMIPVTPNPLEFETPKPDTSRRNAIVRAISWGANALSDSRKFNPFEQVRRSSYFSTFSNSTVWAIREIKRRSAELESYIEHQKTNIAGVGPNPTFETVKDEEDRRALREAWAEWSDKVDPSQLESWPGIMQALVGNAALDGRAFLIVRYNDAYRGGVAFQPLSRDWLVDDFSFQELKEKVWDGTAYDYANGIYYEKGTGKAVAYEFFKTRPGGILFGNRMGERVTISADFVLDLHYPATGADFWSHPPEAIIAAVPYLYALSCIDTDFLGIMKKQGEYLGFLQVDPDNIPDMDDELLEIYKNVPPPENLPKDREVPLLPIGTKWQGVDSSVPNPNTADHKKGLIRAAAAALQVSYATLSGDVSDGNYSSNRAATIEERNGYEIRQDHLIRKICKRAIGHWLINIIATDGLMLRRPASVMQALKSPWRMKRWEAIDELKSARALQTRVGLGVTSIPHEIESHGGNVDDTIAEMKEWNEKLKAAGLTQADIHAMGGKPSGGASDGDRPERDPDDRDDDEDD